MHAREKGLCIIRSDGGLLDGPEKGIGQWGTLVPRF